MYNHRIKIDASKYSTMIIHGFTYEHPFNFRPDNNDLISDGYWSRSDLQWLLDGKLNCTIDGNTMIVNENADYKFLRTIGMKNSGEKFFITIPEYPTEIILNFTFESEVPINRDWNYPVPFDKPIELYDNCTLWVTGMLNGQKINNPLQQFNIDMHLE